MIIKPVSPCAGTEEALPAMSHTSLTNRVVAEPADHFQASTAAPRTEGYLRKNRASVRLKASGRSQLGQCPQPINVICCACFMRLTTRAASGGVM